MEQILQILNITIKISNENEYETLKKHPFIKNKYQKLSYKEKSIYKLYVYSISNIKYNLKDKIWEYLNEPVGSCYFVSKDTLLEFLQR